MPSLERRGNSSISLAPLYLNLPEVSSSTSIHGGPDADKVSIREVGAAAAAALSPSDPTTRYAPILVSVLIFVYPLYSMWMGKMSSSCFVGWVFSVKGCSLCTNE